MNAPLPSRVTALRLPPGEGGHLLRPLPLGEGRGEGAPAPTARDGCEKGLRPPARRAFTLIELLVTVSIIVVLAGLFGAAIAAARNGAVVNTTTNAVVRLNQIVSTQFRRYESWSVSPLIVAGVRQMLGTSGTNGSAARAWHIRRNLITADMPDRWNDVAFMTTGTAYTVTVSGSVTPDVLGSVYNFSASYTGSTSTFTVRYPLTAAQAAYIATYNAASPKPTDQYGGAECLFMIVMQGGFADCLDCNGLRQLKKGDKDNDGALEFWDDWNNPIDYILWAPGFRGSGDTTAFFSQLDTAFPTTGSVRPALGMRPLVYSAGPDSRYGLARESTTVVADSTAATSTNLNRGSPPVGLNCGNPADAGTGAIGRPVTGTGEVDRADNIVNVEQKAAS